jgi:multidrug efflux pump subunit AcrA (membrane-fusion protein)
MNFDRPIPRKDDELISSEVQEIVSYRPHWVVRKGNLIFLLVLFLLLAFTWFIKYPDIIRGSMKLTAIDAPKQLTARTEGKLAKLLVTNEENVTVNQPIAFLQSTADHKQVLALRNWINRIEPFIVRDSLEILSNLPVPVFDRLGEVQSEYQSFQNVLKETVQILDNGYYRKKKQALIQDLGSLSAIQKNTEQQQQLLTQDFELQQQEYKANETLATEKVIAPIELNQNKSKVITKDQGLHQIATQLIDNIMSQHNKQKEILDLQKYIYDQRQKFRSELFDLKSKVDEWIQQYVIIAPENGNVLFSSFLQENQLLTAGQELFYVQPPQSSYYGQLMVSQTGFGKIKPGQKVLIRVRSYPSNEFGYITGEINYISGIPTTTDSFLIKVQLPKGLRTNYDKIILFRNNLIADADVVTDNRTLFERFLGQVKDLFKR